MPDEWYVIVARHLGLRIFEEEFPCPAPGCKKMMDVFADHAMVCFCKGDRTRRHNAERNVIHNDMRVAGLFYLSYATKWWKVKAGRHLCE